MKISKLRCDTHHYENDQLGLGLTDMGKKIHRQQGSSSDHSLFPVEFMNIIQIIYDHPTIDTLIVSGGTDGNSSLSWFSIFCDLNGITFKPKKLKRGQSIAIRMGQRYLKVVLGYSTSSAAIGVNYQKLIDDYREILR